MTSAASEPTTTINPRKTTARFGAYSAAYRRGSVSRSIDGRSVEGRLARHMEADLLTHAGGNPSVTTRLLIENAVRVRLRLEPCETKMDMGSWSDLDRRTYGGLLNAYRLILRELGFSPAAAPPSPPVSPLPTLAELVRAATADD